MSEQDDKTFLRHFSMVIVVLVIFTIVIAFLGGYLNSKLAPGVSSAQKAAVEERIKTTAGVYTEQNPAPQEAKAAAPANALAQVVEDAPAEAVDGEKIYQNACFACHGTGAAGAPKLEKDAWTERLAKGEETLLDHAINGFNAMPPKGGQMQLSDAEIKASVDFMLSKVR